MGVSDYVNFLIDFTAGGISGVVAKTATAPIERVKLVIQTQDANPLIKSGQVPRYNGMRDCFVRLFKERGLKSFWDGNFTNVIRYFPTQAFNFAFKDAIKGLFPKYNPRKEFGFFFLTNLASGGLAGAASLCIVYPLDYARTRLGTDVGKAQKSFNGLADCLIKTVRGPSGILGLYYGFGISLAGTIPFRGLFFGLYDSLASINPFKRDHGFLGLASKFAIAQTTAIISNYVYYPFDTVKRLLQMQSEKPKEQWLYKGTWDCIRKIQREEGTVGFFKGAGVNILRAVGSALVLVLYGEIQNSTGFFGGVVREE